MAAFLSPIGNAGIPFFTQQGVILAGGLIYTYQAGTTTPQATWTTPAQSVQNSNPIVLNSSGLPPQEVWLQSGLQYKFVIQDSNANTLQTLDSISGVNDNTTSQSQWVALGIPPTYVSGTQFSVPGNQSAIFTFNRRVQATISAGTITGTVSGVSFSTVTTVTVAWDSGQLDNGLTQILYGLIGSNPTSAPNALLNIQSFASHGTSTYTPSGGTVSALVRVIGAGGGAAGCPSTGGSNYAAAGGGGGGAYCESFFRSVSTIAGQTITVGQGGAGGIAGLNSGGSGTASSIGAIMSASGGSGSTPTAASTQPFLTGFGGGGSAPSTGNLSNFAGNPGSPGFSFAGNLTIGGNGGASGCGGGGPVGAGGGSAGVNSSTAGAGGSGASQAPSGAALVGGNGADGLVIILEYS